MSNADHSHKGSWHLPHLHKPGHKSGPGHTTDSSTNVAGHSDTVSSTTIPSITKVALAGITGKLGRHIAKHLLDFDHVEVHGIARNPDKLPNDLKSNPRLKLFKSNLTDTSTIRDAVAGCSILISTILSDPASEIAMQKAMIDACAAEGVPRFMPNEFTIDWRTLDLDLLPQKKVNQKIFDYLEKQHGKVKGVHVLVGGFMETMFSAGFWFDPSNSPAEGLSTWGTGDEVWEMTSYDNAARYAAAAALDENATGFLRFLGDRLTVKEIAKVLQDVYNLPPISFTSKGSLRDLKEQVKEGITKEPDSPDFWTWKGQSHTLFLANGQAYLELPVTSAPYENFVARETLEDWLQDKKLEELSKTAWTL